MSTCTNCDQEHELLICDGCAADRYAHRSYEDNHEGTREDELGDVLEFFKQLEVDQLRSSNSLSLAEIAARLERGEHRA